MIRINLCWGCFSGAETIDLEAMVTTKGLNRPRAAKPDPATGAGDVTLGA